MSKEQYESFRYIGQELHLALRRLFTKNQFGDIQIQHRDDESKKESLLFYSVYGVEVRLGVSKIAKRYHLNVQVGDKDSEHLETKVDTDIKISRSKTGRVSPQCMDDIAVESLDYLKEFYRARKSKQ